MKSNTAVITAIVIWSIVALLLIAVLAMGLFGFGSLGRNLFSFAFSDYHYENGGEYTAGEAQIDADIKALDIDWVSGGVNIVPYDGDMILISEDNGGYSDDLTMRWRVSGDKLYIRFGKSKMKWGIFRSVSKTLTVKLPAETAQALTQVKLEAVSADISVQEITADRLRAHTVSGGIEITQSCAGVLDLGTVSGYMQAQGNFGSLNSESVSGDCEIVDSVMPSRIDAQSVSGDMRVTMPDGDGFTAKFDKVSGDFSCEFPTTNNNGKYVYADGVADYNFDTVSGDMTICKAEQDDGQ